MIETEQVIETERVVEKNERESLYYPLLQSGGCVFFGRWWVNKTTGTVFLLKRRLIIARLSVGRRRSRLSTRWVMIVVCLK